MSTKCHCPSGTQIFRPAHGCCLCAWRQLFATGRGMLLLRSVEQLCVHNSALSWPTCCWLLHRSPGQEGVASLAVRTCWCWKRYQPVSLQLKVAPFMHGSRLDEIRERCREATLWMMCYRRGHTPTLLTGSLRLPSLPSTQQSPRAWPAPASPHYLFWAPSPPALALAPAAPSAGTAVATPLPAAGGKPLPLGSPPTLLRTTTTLVLSARMYSWACARAPPKPFHLVSAATEPAVVCKFSAGSCDTSDAMQVRSHHPQ